MAARKGTSATPGPSERFKHTYINPKASVTIRNFQPQLDKIVEKFNKDAFLSVFPNFKREASAYLAKKQIKPYVNKCFVVVALVTENANELQFFEISPGVLVPLHLYLCPAKLNLKDPDIKCFALIFTTEDALKCFHTPSFGFGLDSIYCPQDQLLKYIETFKPKPSSTKPQKNTIEIYSGHFSDIVEILNHKTIPEESRIGSLFYSLFEWVRPAYDERYKVLSTDDCSQIKNVPKYTPECLKSPEMIESVIVRMVLHSIGPSYPRNNLLASKLRSNAETICTSISVDAPQECLFTAFIEKLGWNANKQNSEVEFMLSRVLCWSKDLIFDQLVTNDTIAPIQLLLEKYNTEEFFLAFLKQMRVVYQQRHTSSTNFGLTYLHLFNTFLRNKGDRWAVEAMTINQIKDIVVKSKYAGISPIIDEKLRVVNFPRVILFGLLVHKYSLQAESEQNTFSFYRLESVKKHIRYPADIKFIETMAQHKDVQSKVRKETQEKSVKETVDNRDTKSPIIFGTEIASVGDTLMDTKLEASSNLSTPTEDLSALDGPVK